MVVEELGILAWVLPVVGSHIVVVAEPSEQVLFLGRVPRLGSSYTAVAFEGVGERLAYL